MTRARIISALLGLSWLIVTGPVWAHAQLLDSRPAADAILEHSPPEVLLRFNEGVGLIDFRVLDSTGAEVSGKTPARADGDTLHLTLPAALARGTYVVTYRVISADTHPVGGSYAFSIGVPTAAGRPPVDTGNSWTLPVMFSRWVLYTSVLVAAGSALFLLYLPEPAASALAAENAGRIAAIIGIAGYLVMAGVGGADLLGGGLGGGPQTLLSSKPWTTASSTTLGTSALIGIPGLLLLILAFSRRSRAALMVGAAAALGGFVVTGHAATAPPAFIMAPAVFIHLLGAAFWLGALYPLYFVSRALPPGEAGMPIKRFSRMAFYAVAGIVLSGIIVTWVQMQRLGAFTDTPYGVRLAIKLLLFAALLSLATLNKFVLTGRLAQGAWAARSLRRSIAAEYGLYLLILGAAASLTVTPPPRAVGKTSIQAPATGFRGVATEGSYTATVEVTPDHPGENMFMVVVKDSEGRPLPLAGVTLVLTLPSAGIANIEKQGEAAGAPGWHFMVPETVVPGDWHASIGAFIDTFTKADFEMTIPIR